MSEPRTDAAVLTAFELHKRFREGGGEGAIDVTVQRGLSLQVRRGETLAIVGASGSGKSTLLHLMGGLDHPDTGTIRVRGVSLQSLGPADLARFRNRDVGLIFQAFHLMPEFDALENVMLPGRMARRPLAEVQAEADALLKRVGLGDRLDHRPGELSGGEQQRLSIGRALLGRPRVLLLDEPFSHVDGFHKERLLQLLTAWQRKTRCTVVLVSFAQSCTLTCHTQQH
jgi:lipoprotein-releasing system ATP-binding protein